MIDVVVAGGGPTGVMLASELRLHGVQVVVLERDAEPSPIVRSLGLHARSIEIMDQRGLLERFLALGQQYPLGGFFAGISKPAPDRLDTAHPYVLGIPQNITDRLLAEHAAEVGAEIRRGRELVGLSQDEDGVTAELADGTRLGARYLVGCDGGRSLIRKTAGIAFSGWDSTISNLIAEVQMTEEPPFGLRRDARGIHSLSKVEGGQAVGVLVTEQRPGRTDEPTMSDLSETLISVYGTDFGLHSPTFISRFTDATRQAESYRNGRVLLAGDAAHVHYPVGGQGLNIGVQDAVNLGWKLAQVVKKTSSDALLDTYHAERHPVAAAVLRNTMAQVALFAYG